MIKNEFIDRTFPKEHRPVYASVYTVVGILIYMMGVSTIKVLPKLIISANGVLSMIGIIVFAVHLLKHVGRLEDKTGRIVRVGHVFIVLGLLASVLQVLLSGSFHSLRVAPVALLLLALFVGLAKLLIWMTGRSKVEIDRLVLDRGQSASRPFIFGTGQFVVLGMMRPKRRALFLTTIFVLAATVTVAALVLFLDKHYVVAGALFLLFFVGDAIIESVMYAEVVDRKSVEGELTAARTIQMGLMPKEDPVVKGFDISGRCVPANEVGGDFFDYVWLDENKTQLGIALADVSGKALKAAMTAVMTSGMVYQELGDNHSPKSILRKINRPMFLKTDRQVFTAMSFAVLDTRKKTLRFSNAGQSRPILLRNGGLKYIRVKGTRLPLGVREEQRYEEATVKLRSGDTLLFYTDGLPEATNAKNELLGFEAVERQIKKQRTHTAAEIVRGMTEMVDRHTEKTEQHDDMTVVVVNVL